MLPADAFRAIVPALIALALVLVLLGRGSRRGRPPPMPGMEAGGATAVRRAPQLVAGILLAGVYGGYFGAAQGVAAARRDERVLAAPLQQINGIKNVLGTPSTASRPCCFCCSPASTWTGRSSA